jgi:hypothetical protein
MENIPLPSPLQLGKRIFMDPVRLTADNSEGTWVSILARFSKGTGL